MVPLGAADVAACVKARFGLDHVTAARLHTARRCWQRFGLAVGDKELIAAESDIAIGKCLEVPSQQPPNRTAYRVAIKGREVVAVYDAKIGAIVTVLPCEQWAGLTEQQHEAKQRYLARRFRHNA